MRAERTTQVRTDDILLHVLTEGDHDYDGKLDRAPAYLLMEYLHEDIHALKLELEAFIQAGGHASPATLKEWVIRLDDIGRRAGATLILEDRLKAARTRKPKRSPKKRGRRGKA